MLLQRTQDVTPYDPVARLISRSARFMLSTSGVMHSRSSALSPDGVVLGFERALWLSTSFLNPWCVRSSGDAGSGQPSDRRRVPKRQVPDLPARKGPARRERPHSTRPALGVRAATTARRRTVLGRPRNGTHERGVQIHPARRDGRGVLDVWRRTGLHLDTTRRSTPKVPNLVPGLRQQPVLEAPPRSPSARDGSGASGTPEKHRDAHVRPLWAAARVWRCSCILR